MAVYFLWGCLAVSSVLAGLYFCRFWRDARERLFLYFAIAFWMLAINWIMLATVRQGHEGTHFAYFIRMAAFLAILVGVVDKNRRR
jgi:hypothetical protein